MKEANGEELLNGKTAPPVKAGKNCGSRPLPEIEMENSREETLYGVLHRFFSEIFFIDRSSSSSLLEKTKASVSHNASLLREGFKNTSRDLLLCTRRGSPLRAFLVVTVGTIILLALTGFLVFMLFFLAATINAVIISLVISLAAAGCFVMTIYIGAPYVAAFAISTATVSTIIAVMIATGWIGFFWAVWLATMKSMGLAKHSLNMTGSALSAYSAAL